jgi:nicotinamidase-related amidase
MSVEHTARTGADKGYVMQVAEDACSIRSGQFNSLGGQCVRRVS